MPPSTDPLEPKNQIELITEQDKINAIKRFNLDINRPLLTQVGRFDPAKGFDRVYKIYKLVKEKIPEVQLLLTGAGAADDPEFYVFINPSLPPTFKNPPKTGYFDVVRRRNTA